MITYLLQSEFLSRRRSCSSISWCLHCFPKSTNDVGIVGRPLHQSTANSSVLPKHIPVAFLVCSSTVQSDRNNLRIVAVSSMEHLVVRFTTDFSGGEWNSGGHCRESTLGPNDSRVWPMPEINVMLEQVSKQMKNPVTILNITDLSRLRMDGHPSVYRRKGVDLTASSAQDCSHWCLPGVPDTWNELLLYHLVSSRE